MPASASAVPAPLSKSDEAKFDSWVDALAGLRQDRQDQITNLSRKRANTFSAADFFEVATASFETVIERWYKIQMNASRGGLANAVSMRDELSAVLEFERNAIEKELAFHHTQFPWDEGLMAEKRALFESFVLDIERKFQIKLDDIADGNRRKAAELAAAPTVIHVGHSSRSGGNSMGMVVMFVVGLFFGGSPSVYFWYSAKDSEQVYQEERSKLIKDQRAMEDGLAVLRDTFEQLANGKLKSLPALEREIADVKSLYESKRSDIVGEYTRDRERILKKIPPGNRQDDAIHELVTDRDRRLVSVDSRQKDALDSIIKQRDMLRALLNH